MCNYLLDQLQFLESYHKSLNHFFLVNRKNFFHRSKHYNHVSEENISFDFLKYPYLQMIKERVYLLLEKLDQLKKFNICFTPDLLF